MTTEVRREPVCIAVDAMGGDDAPRDPVAGTVEYVLEDGTPVLLVGDEAAIERELAALAPPARVRELIEIQHADEVVEMDEPAITPIRKKRRSSIRLAAQAVREGRAQALVSAGNTGAAMISAKMVIGTAAGVDRPALAALLPNGTGNTLVVDVGANVDSKPEHLLQFAVMGHFYAREVLAVDRPKIGLLSIGEEEGKGNDFTVEAYRLLDGSGLNFVGNVEGGDLFRSTCHVVVCDGFVGNVVLKSAEVMAEVVGKMLRQEFKKRMLSMLGYLLVRPSIQAFRKRVDYSEYGGAPLLGLKGGCFIAHGRSNPRAIKNAIRRAVEFCQVDTANKISERLEKLAAESGVQAPPAYESSDREVSAS